MGCIDKFHMIEKLAFIFYRIIPGWSWAYYEAQTGYELMIFLSLFLDYLTDGHNAYIWPIFLSVI